MEMTLDLNPTDVSLGDEQDYDVIIIGGGPAGATAAIYTARADLKTLVIDKGLTAGTLGITGKIANYPGILEEVSRAFIYIQGSKPITDFLEGQLSVSETGCLVVDKEFQTGIPSLFAMGDVLCNHIKQAVVAAAEGAVAGMAAEKQVHGRKKLAVDWSK